jgi:hypothetical protein
MQSLHHPLELLLGLRVARLAASRPAPLPVSFLALLASRAIKVSSDTINQADKKRRSQVKPTRRMGGGIVCAGILGLSQKP